MNAKPDLVDPREKAITLGDIAPKWAKRLEEEKKLPFPLSIRWFKWYFELDIPSRCIVGEANGFEFIVPKKSVKSVIVSDGNLDTHFLCAQD